MPSSPDIARRSERLARIESGYDAIARAQARAEAYGPLVLFVREGPGWPLYARPAPAADRPVTVDDVAAVRARQRELGVPEAFEWVHDLTPELLPAAEQSGLSVLRAPLLVRDAGFGVASPALPDGVRIRLLDPTGPTFAADVTACRAVSAVGFGAAGTAAGPGGASEREAARRPLDPADLAAESARVATGLVARVIAEDVDGPVATGALLRAGDVAEIAGVATLPSARRQGLGAAVTAALTRQAGSAGVGLIFLSAGSEDVARIYQRVGFERIGLACVAEPPHDAG